MNNACRVWGDSERWHLGFGVVVLWCCGDDVGWLGVSAEMRLEEKWHTTISFLISKSISSKVQNNSTESTIPYADLDTR